MNVAFQQATRRGRLSTALGPDVLVLLRLRGTHRMNGTAAFSVEALSADGALDLDALVGTEATVAITAEGGPAHFSGIVTEAVWAGVGDGGHRYDLTLRPWLHLAGLRRQSRIFHRRTVLEILAQVLAPYAHLGSPAVEITCDKAYPVLEYTVQYRESDADFARRLMERFGISHVVRMHAGGHTLVVTDGADHLAKVAGGKRPFRRTQSSHGTEEEHFRDWRQGTRVTTGAVRLTDYNFKTPLAAMEADRTGEARHAEGAIEAYDWPGDHLTQAQGRQVAATRLAAERGQAARVAAVGDVCSLQAGMRVQLTGDRIPGATGKLFVCLEAVHDYTAEGYVTGGKAAETDHYTGRYTLMPATAPLAPEAKTPVPTVLGPQTAVVVGEGEIDCDEYGRILVRFHWDLAGAYSMRCRVSQNWASQGWGGMVIPRIGMEVMVDFLDGDPDKPLVTGCVYNGRNMPHYPLPAHKTKSVFRTDTHQGDGFNEFTFEDQKGVENMFFHAQKDQTTRVLNDQTQRVDRHAVAAIGQNRVVEVGGNQKHEVGGSVNMVVGGTATSALALMGAVAGLAGHTAGLLKQAGDVAGGGGPALGAFAATVAASGLGFLGAAGVLNRGRVVGGANDGQDAGRALGDAGSGVGEDADGLFPMPGVMNTIVGSFRSDTVGIAAVEQIGMSKVVNVGATALESVGKYKKIAVGEEFVIECGDSKFIMKANGEILILGKTFNFVASDHFQMRGKPIDLN